MGDPAKDEASQALGRELLTAAFEVARASGKEHWQRMLAGVLKNRLLLITGGAFDEQQWGVSSFLQFVELYPDLVSVDRSSHPPAVHLKGAPSPETAADAPPRPGSNQRWSIRSDLWRAVLEYSKGEVFVWEDGWAVPMAPNVTPEQEALVLPTVTGDELRSWRLAFIADLPTPHADEKLAHWADSGISSWALPPPLRGQWFDYLKHKVRDRLESWFREQDLEIPEDLVERKAARRRQEAEPPELDALRQLVLECVRAMSRSELEELRLPPAALLRARRPR